MGFDHVEVGVGLFDKWGIDPELTKSIGLHHDPISEKQQKNESNIRVAMRTASLFADKLFSKVPGNRFYPRASQLEFEMLLKNRFKFDTSTEDDLFKNVERRIAETSGGFSIKIGDAPSSEELLLAASEMLSQLAVKSMMNPSLDDQSLRDPMTGLFNRRKLDEAEMVRIDHMDSVGVLFIDVDRFKAINDKFGHQSGDDAICLVAHTLKQAVRDNDVIVRYGGDEFVVILKNVSDEVLAIVADRIAMQLEKSCENKSFQSRITLSIGGVCEELLKIESVRDNHIKKLIEKADQAMYEAKRGGGNRIRYAAPQVS